MPIPVPQIGHPGTFWQMLVSAEHPIAVSPHLFCVSRAPWHRLRRANRAPEDPAFVLGSAGLSRRRPLRQSVMAGRALPMTIEPSRSIEANAPPEHRCAFARSPQAIALQMPSPTNRPCSLTVKVHAIAGQFDHLARPSACHPPVSLSPWARASTRSARLESAHSPPESQQPVS